MSIVFDRAVAYYDQTRAMPEDRHRAMIDALVREAEIQPNDHALEIGIGTGRIAVSVAEHVRHVAGIDLSEEMMSVLRGKLAQRGMSIDLARANAVELPFPDNCFDVTYAVHVYHLVQNWQAGIAEAMRVTKPGRHFVVSFHARPPDSPNARLRQHMHLLAQEYGIDTKRPGVQSDQELLREVGKWDASPRVVVFSEWRAPEIPAKILEELDRQIFSETWTIPREVMDRVMPRLRAWAEQTYGDLDAPLENDHQARWLVAQKRARDDVKL